MAKNSPSFTKVPLASDDNYSWTEDQLLSSSLYNGTTKVLTLDVMSNDGGGSGKQLWSIDDGNGNPLAQDPDLLTGDVGTNGVSAWERTAAGNLARINNGKVEVDLSHSLAPFHGDLNAMGASDAIHDSFVYAIRLGNGSLSQAVARIDITGVNDAATITVSNSEDTTVMEAGGANNGTTGDASASGTLTVHDVDVGQDHFLTPASLAGTYGTYTFNTTTGAWGYTLNNAAANVEALTAGQVVYDHLNVTSADGTATYDIKVKITGADDAPVVTSGATATVAENVSTSTTVYTASATDVDAGDTISWSLTGDDAGLFNIDSAGHVTFKASPDFENPQDVGGDNVYNINVVATDSGSLAGSKAVAITVTDQNDNAPVITTSAVQSVNENTAFSVALTSTDADTVGTNPATFSITGGSDSALFSIDGTGHLTMTAKDFEHPIDTNHNESYVVQVTANDGANTTNKTITVTIHDLNDNPPVITTSATQSVNENAAFSVALTSTDVDLNSIKPATFSITGGADSALFSIDATGHLTMAAKDFENPTDADANNTYVVQVSAFDGVNTTDKTITVTVGDINEAPAGADNTVSMLEDTSYTFAASDFGFSDPSDNGANSLLAVKIATLPTAGALTLNGVAVSEGDFVAASDIAAGNLTFTPDANANGTGYASFTFQVQDDGGTANGGIDLAPTPNTITLDVTPVNDAPADTDHTVSIFEDTVYTFVASDFPFSDPLDSPADSLLAVKISTLPTAGSLTLSGVAVNEGDVVAASDIAAGLLTFTPDADANGLGYASFTFQVQDDGGTANGGVDLAPTAGTLTIDVEPFDDAPVNTVPGDQTVNQETLTAITGLSVSDVDLGTGDIEVSLSTDHGNLTLGTTTGLTFSDAAGDHSMVFSGSLSDVNTALASLSYQGDAAYSGGDTLTMTSNDLGNTGIGGPLTDTGTVGITVNAVAVNHAPVAANDAWVVTQITTATLGTSAVLWNDTDSDGDALSVTGVQGTGAMAGTGVGATTIRGATVTLLANGTLRYVAGNTLGADSFTYQISDGHGGTSTATVSVNVVSQGIGTGLAALSYDHSYINATGGNDTVTGGSGVDIILGGAGNDSLSGGDGNDSIDGGTGADSIFGGAGNDTIVGAQDDIVLNGGDGTDTLAVGANFTSTSDAQIDAIEVVTLTSSGKTLDLSNQTENFVIYGTMGADKIIGGSGDDTITPGIGVDTINGGAGNDTIILVNILGPGASVDGGAGIDTIKFGSASLNITGGTVANVENLVAVDQGDQTLFVTAAQWAGFSSIDLKAGNDKVITSFSGSVDISAAGVTTVSNVEAGTLTGSTGDDSITLRGDQLDGMAVGSAMISLGLGSNTINLTSTSSALNGLNDQHLLNVQAISAAGATAGVAINLSSQSEAFTLTGGAYDDTLSGGSGADTIVGGAGNDSLSGGGGNDTLVGGIGSDTLTGGAGADQFRLRTDGGTDTITDFIQGTDKIGLLGGAVTGGLNFANTTGSAAGTQLSATDYIPGPNSILFFAGNKVVEMASAMTTAQIMGITAAFAQAAYVVVFNSTTGHGEIWFDTNWVTQAARVQIASLDNITTLAGVSALSNTDFVVYDTTIAPAGAAGSAINLALTDPTASTSDMVTVTVSGAPSGWVLDGGTQLADGSWTIDTLDPSALSITTPGSYAGAALLNVTETWVNADGTIGTTTVSDNVEAFAPGAPIFAIAGDDNLTASSANDLFVFAQPIGHDVVRGFDVAHDTIDLVGYGITSFADVHLTTDASGNAVITLGDGQTITLDGVDASSLSASNFAFDQVPVTVNTGSMIVSDGAVLPLAGIVDNSGTILLDSTGGSTTLELIQNGLTLQGGGHLTLTDSDGNIITAADASVTFTNVDNIISGAGQLGSDRDMTLINQGTIVASGSHALEINTGSIGVQNSGTLEATGSGGLVVDGALANSGTLWANGGNITVVGTVTGGTAIIDGTSTIEFGAASSADVTFGAGDGTLKLDDASSFTGTVSGFGAGDTIDFADVTFSTGTALQFTATATGGVLTMSDGVHSASVALAGIYTADDFTIAADATTGTQVMIAHATDHLV